MMRRLMALALAVGLLPAASGGAACLAHWGTADAAEYAAHGHVAHHGSTAFETGAHAHADPEHAPHGHTAHEFAADASTAPAGEAPDGAPAPDEPPCTALATCGALVTPERAVAPLRLAATSTARVLRHAQRPLGPRTAPDVPPPRS